MLAATRTARPIVALRTAVNRSVLLTHTWYCGATHSQLRNVGAPAGARSGCCNVIRDDANAARWALAQRRRRAAVASPEKLVWNVSLSAHWTCWRPARSMRVATGAVGGKRTRFLQSSVSHRLQNLKQHVLLGATRVASSRQPSMLPSTLPPPAIVLNHVLLLAVCCLAWTGDQILAGFYWPGDRMLAWFFWHPGPGVVDRRQAATSSRAQSSSAVWDAARKAREAARCVVVHIVWDGLARVFQHACLISCQC